MLRRTLRPGPAGSLWDCMWNISFTLFCIFFSCSGYGIICPRRRRSNHVCCTSGRCLTHRLGRLSLAEVLASNDSVGIRIIGIGGVGDSWSGLIGAGSTVRVLGK